MLPDVGFIAGVKAMIIEKMLAGQELTGAEYIALSRRRRGQAIQNACRHLCGLDLDAEAQLIAAKRSTLSAVLRTFVLEIVAHRKAKA